MVAYKIAFYTIAISKWMPDENAFNYYTIMYAWSIESPS